MTLLISSFREVSPQKKGVLQNAFLEKITPSQLCSMKLTTGAEKLFRKTPLDDCLFTDQKIKNDFNKTETIPGK